MTVVSATATQSQVTVDDLLRAVAEELRHFLQTLLELDIDSISWRETFDDACAGLSDRLADLELQIQRKREKLAGAVEAIRLDLTAYRDDLAESGRARIDELHASLTERYEALVDTLRTRRIVEPQTLTANRAPKLVRAAFHAGMGIASVLLYQLLFNRGQALWVLGGFATFFGTIEILRRFSPKLNDFWVDRVFGRIARPQERYRTNSATFYLWGLLVITLLAPKSIVCAAILVLAFGDPAASAVGFRWPLHRFANDKSLGGSLAFIAAAAAVLAIFFAITATLPASTWLPLALIMPLIGMAAETFNGKIDDNFLIPVATAAGGLLYLALLS